VFAHSGGYQSAQAFTDGVVPAVKLGALIVALGGVAALLIPRKPVPAPEPESITLGDLEPSAA
ncbi:MAG TPA: hypothetical protein VII50_09130, partial [Acidothermaceae bacterium]